MGATVTSASAALDEDLVQRVRDSLTETPAQPDTAAPVPSVSFVAPHELPAPEPEPAGPEIAVAEDVEDGTAEPDDVREAAEQEATGARRRRRRGRRGRGSSKNSESDTTDTTDASDAADTAGTADTADTAATAQDEGSEDTAAQAPDAEGDGSADSSGDGGSGSSRRRRRRRRSGGGGNGGSGNGGSGNSGNSDNANSGAETKGGGDDGVRAVKGSTRLEAKRQRRRDGRDSGRRRPPIVTEAEFLARRESVNRVMALREHDDRTQIAVLEDDVLVEHFVTRASATSYVGNVYLGRVQNVLPSMEAAFVDIGKGRNGVLYAGEVNWDAAGLEGKARAIENALSSGDTVLVQVTKDPIGHKGARLTSQVSLPGRFLVYVPGGGMTGISRKLPDTERHRLKAILKKIVPEDAGVIIRTAAEGASEQELARDVERLQAQWQQIERQAANSKSAPKLVHGEPDLAIRVVRDVFNEDFSTLVVQGEQAWRTVSDYVEQVAPDLGERVSRHTADTDLFHDLRVDEQLAKALDRKVWLPSGGSLIIDRTEAMTVIDVNTGKFVGAGGNLEQTVTRNNLEAAEEIVRQLRLRDVGGIVVIDFIDMVLQSNRELVLRRLTECLGRDRTRHQVAEVTSLGLVQMTRKRVGEGLLEAFSEPCPTCNGRGVIVHSEPVALPENNGGGGGEERSRGKRRRGGSAKAAPAEPVEVEAPEDRERRLAAMAAIHRAAHPDDETPPDELGAGPETPGPETADVPDTAEVPDAADANTTDVADAPPEPPPTDGHQPTPRSGGTRPRRRRAASRPAGPPVAVDQS